MDFVTEYPILTGIAAVVIAFVLIAWAFAKNYVKVPPDMVAVFSGRGKTERVNGGARFRMPLIEQVDKMSLATFNIEVPVKGVYSKDLVPISVDAISVVAFGLSAEALVNSTARFLHIDHEAMKPMIEEILAGNMRNIVSQMTVEQLSSNREDFSRLVADEATSSLTPLGLELKVFSIKNITDANGYLDALGQGRIAEVKRDAAIGRANAERDAMVQAAAATQQGKKAQAEAATLIADAERDRDLRIAANSSQVEAEQARAAQAGPLAEAQAHQAVVLAGVASKRAETEALIGVEEQRAKQKERAVQADIIIPANADRDAAIARAEGEREATIAAATAAARQRELQGRADADARTLAAAADQAELVAKAEGEKAMLLAQAEGQEKLALALAAYTDQAARLNVLPQLIAVLPQIMEAVANGVKIDKMVVMDGGAGGENSAIGRAIGVAPAVLNKALVSMDALGIDLSGLLGGIFSGDNGDKADATTVESTGTTVVETHSNNSVPQPVA